MNCFAFNKRTRQCLLQVIECSIERTSNRCLTFFTNMLPSAAKPLTARTALSVLSPMTPYNSLPQQTQAPEHAIAGDAVCGKAKTWAFVSTVDDIAEMRNTK